MYVMSPARTKHVMVEIDNIIRKELINYTLQKHTWNIAINYNRSYLTECGSYTWSIDRIAEIKCSPLPWLKNERRERLDSL